MGVVITLRTIGLFLNAALAIFVLTACGSSSSETQEDDTEPNVEMNELVIDDAIQESDIRDDDGDGLSNQDETSLGTNPLISDTDGDGILDGVDSAPLVPSPSEPAIQHLEWYETLLGANGVNGIWYCTNVIDNDLSQSNNPEDWEQALTVDWADVYVKTFFDDRTVVFGSLNWTYWYQEDSSGKYVTLQNPQGGFVNFYFNEENGQQMIGGGQFCKRTEP